MKPIENSFHSFHEPTQSARRKSLFWRIHFWAALVASPFALGAALTGVLYLLAKLQEVVVKSQKSGVPNNTPSTTETVTAKQIAESINAVTTAGTLNYLPSTHVRERYIGDRNSILVMRVNSSTSSAQTTVYADNLLLSNFLNSTANPVRQFEI